MPDLTKKIIDSCFLAKRITEMLPPLPKGMKARHIHVIDAVFTLTRARGNVKVSDISRALNVTTPSVTKLVQELCRLGAAEKYADEKDGRIAFVRLTPLGETYYRRHVENFHAKLAEAFADISEDDRRLMIATIEKVYARMETCLKKYSDAKEGAEP